MKGLITGFGMGVLLAACGGMAKTAASTAMDAVAPSAALANPVARPTAITAQGEKVIPGHLDIPLTVAANVAYTPFNKVHVEQGQWQAKGIAQIIKNEMDQGFNLVAQNCTVLPLTGGTITPDPTFICLLTFTQPRGSAVPVGQGGTDVYENYENPTPPDAGVSE